MFFVRAFFCKQCTQMLHATSQPARLVGLDILRPHSFQTFRFVFFEPEEQPACETGR
jgi:hypothetical protein